MSNLALEHFVFVHFKSIAYVYKNIPMLPDLQELVAQQLKPRNYHSSPDN